MIIIESTGLQKRSYAIIHRGVFKSSCANAQAHSGQEFPTLTTGGRSIDLIFWEPKSFGCRQQITGGAAFALSDKFLKIKFLKL